VACDVGAVHHYFDPCLSIDRDGKISFVSLNVTVDKGVTFFIDY